MSRVCPKCGSADAKMIISRISHKNGARLRRYVCVACPCRWTTEEKIIEQSIVAYSPEGKRYKNGKSTHQLCWTCQRVGTMTCEWDRDFTPVPGWEAEPTEITEERHGKLFVIKSYCITGCPKYIADKRVAK